MVAEEDLTENFDVQRPFFTMIKNVNLWVELLLMLATPIPTKANTRTIIEINSINWVDNSSVYDYGQAQKIPTPYEYNDFFLAFMFLRFYFFVLALITFSPVNERLYGKRVCKNANFEPTFGFQIKAAFKIHPVFTFFMMGTIMLMSLSYVTRVFERPYFAFNFPGGNADGTA